MRDRGWVRGREDRRREGRWDCGGTGGSEERKGSRANEVLRVGSLPSRGEQAEPPPDSAREKGFVTKAVPSSKQDGKPDRGSAMNSDPLRPEGTIRESGPFFNLARISKQNL